MFVYGLKFKLQKQFAYAGCSKYKSFQNYKTAGINQEPDSIRGGREIKLEQFGITASCKSGYQHAKPSDAIINHTKVMNQ